MTEAAPVVTKAPATEADHHLELANVTAGYSDDIDILRDVSLRVHVGQTVGVIGLNGAGKSTIMRAIHGFVPPRSGRILLDGEDITHVPEYGMFQRRVWYIPQESSLFPF